MTRNNVQLIALETWLELQSYKGVVCVAPAGNTTPGGRRGRAPSPE